MRRVIAVMGLVAGLLFVAPAARAGGGCHGNAERNGTGDTVALSMNCMTPRVLHVEGDSAVVQFVSKDEVTHNIYGDGWGFDEVAPGMSVTHVFGEGTNVYACTLHAGMSGAVVVGDGVGATVAEATPIRARDLIPELFRKQGQSAP